MSLKAFLDTHPVALLVSVGVAIASTTAGATGYVSGQRLETEKAKLEAEYKGELSALKTRLASIERKIGGDEKSYFDVSRLIVTPDRIRELDRGYRSMASGAFFVLEPRMDGWKYAFTSELELARTSLAGSGAEGGLALVAEALGKQNLHLWRHAQTFVIRPTPKKGLEVFAPKKMNLFAYVGVQVLTVNDLRGIVSEFDRAFGDDDRIKSIARRIEVLRNKLDKSGGQTLAVKAEAEGSSDKAEGPPTSGQSRIELEEVMAELFRGDMAAVLLAGLVVQSNQMTRAFADTQAALHSVQKKGNVLYVQSRIKFAGVEVEGRTGRTAFVVDQEYFIVTSPQEIFVVKIQVPSLDGRSDAFQWLSQWLTSFRMPLGRA